MGQVESKLNVIVSFKKLIKYLDKQKISNESIKKKIKILTQETKEFLKIYDCVSGTKISGNISPYFTKIEMALESFEKCAKYIYDNKKAPETNSIKKNFQKDFLNFIKQLTNLAKYITNILEIIQNKSHPSIFKRFYIELSMFDFALTVQSTEKPPFYHLSTLPAYSLHDQILETSKRCISVVGPHKSGKTTLIPMLLASRSLARTLKANCIILIENDPTRVYGIEECYKQMKKSKHRIHKVDDDDGDHEEDGGHDEEEDDDDGDDDDEYDSLLITSSLQKVIELAKIKSTMQTVIAILSPLEALQFFHTREDFIHKSVFIIDDVHQRAIETDVLYQDISRIISSTKVEKPKKISKVTMMSPIPDTIFQRYVSHYEDLNCSPKVKYDVEKRKIKCDQIDEIGRTAIFHEMRKFFDNWLDHENCDIESVITFVPKAKTGKKIIKQIYKYYSEENSLKVVPLRTKIRKGETVEKFNERLINDIEIAFTQRMPNPEAVAKDGHGREDIIFLLPMDITGPIREEEQKFIESQVPLQFIKDKFVRLIIATNQNEPFVHPPDLAVIFDSGLTETEYYDIEKGVSIYKEELLPLPFIEERHDSLGENENNIHFIFEVNKKKRPADLIPAIKRCNMAQSILSLRSIGIKFEEQKKLPIEPNHEIRDSSLKLLKKIGIIDNKTNDLSDVGKIAGKFSIVSPFLALATAKFVEKPEFGFLVSLIIERSVELVENNQSQLLYDHFEPESDVVTLIESILALNVDGENHLIDENDVEVDDSGLSIGTLYSIYTSMSNAFEKREKDEGRKLTIQAIQWAHTQPGGTLGMVDKYVNLLDKENFLDLRRSSFQYIVGAGPGLEPTLVYKTNDVWKFEEGKDAQVKFSQRPGWLGLQSPGNIIVLNLQIEESIHLNRGLLIHRDPSQIGVNPGVSSREEANPSLNSHFFTALFEAYWSGQPTANNFIGIYHTNKPKKEAAFLININECNKRTFINFCPKTAAVKNEMDSAIPILSDLLPFVPHSIVVKSEVPLCAVEVTTYGTSSQYETNLYVFNEPTKPSPIAYPINKTLLEYAHRKINDIQQTNPLIRFSITGECAYYKIINKKQLDADFAFPNSDPTIPSVFHPSYPSHLVFIVNNEYADKPGGVAPIPWLAPAGAEAGFVASNDTDEIKLMADVSAKILNGLGYVSRSDDLFFVTLDGGYPKVGEGEMPETIKEQVGYAEGEEGAIKNGVHQLIYQLTRIFNKEQDLKNPITIKNLSSTSQCTKYSTDDAQIALLAQINAAMIAQLHLKNDDVQSVFLGPSMICVSIRDLPENTTQHPISTNVFNQDYQPCPADANIANILRGIGIPVSTVTHEPTINVTIQHHQRYRMKPDDFIEIVTKIADDFGFLLATKPDYQAGGKDFKSEKNGVLGEITLDFIGKSTCVAFATVVSNEFPVTPMVGDTRVTMTMTMTMTAMTTMRNLKNLDPSLGPVPKVNPITQKAFRVPQSEINAMKELVLLNKNWKIDENYRVLIIPYDDEKEAKKQMLQLRKGDLEHTCLYICGDDYPVLLPQLVYAREKGGHIHPYGICKGCMKVLLEGDEAISTIFNPLTHIIDQEKLKNDFKEPIVGFSILDENRDDEDGLYYPQVAFGQLIWALMSDPSDDLTPLVKAWFSIIVKYTIQNSGNFVFCPNHKDVPIRIPDRGKSVKCPSCNMMYCGTCDIWHRMDEECRVIDFGPGVKRCPNCHLPSFKVSGCNRITCPRCRQSWCYQCGKLCGSVDATYAHISAEGHYEP